MSQDAAPPAGSAAPGYPPQPGAYGYPPQPGAHGYPSQHGAHGYPLQPGAHGPSQPGAHGPSQPGAHGSSLPGAYGSQGYPSQQQPGHAPPGAHGQPAMPHGYSAQHAFSPPHGQPQGYPPQQAFAGYPPQQAAHPPPPGAVGSMKPYPIIFHRGLTRLTGHLHVAPARLYFICQSDKGGMGVALGKAVGGLIGGAIAGAAAPTPGQGGTVADESELQRAAHEHAGSLIMDPQRISKIKDTFWTHAIWFDGTTYAIRSTLDKALKLELGQWCDVHGVKHAGLLPKK